MALDGDTPPLAPDLEAIRHAFWDRSIPYGVLPPLTDDMVETAERALGVKLPHLYVELLRVQNGGYTSPEFRAFPTRQATSWAEDHVPFDELFGIGRADAQYPERGLLDAPTLAGEWDLRTGLVPVCGDGHWWIALDYRRSGPEGEPSVCWYDAGDVPWVVSYPGQILELAPTFDDFVRGLCSEDLFDEEDEPDPGQVGTPLP